jgi:hypothetical protein
VLSFHLEHALASARLTEVSVVPAIQIIQDHSPILLFCFNGIANDKEFDAFLDVLSSVLDSKQKHAYIFDATEAGLTPTAHQRRMGDWMKANRDETRRYTVGCAFVFPSPIFRFVLSAIFMVQPMSCPYLVSGDREKAFAWATDQLKRAGLIDQRTADRAQPGLKAAPRRG